jgi:DNA polymerase elongation subunit (family B)
MPKFYTNVAIRGNRILHRGYENGKPFSEEDVYKPTLFILSKGKSEWKSLDGRPVEPMLLDSIESAREFMEKYSNVSSFPIFGNTEYVYQFIGDEYKGEVEYDFSQLRIAYIDIETESEAGFPDIATANERINVITIVCGHKKYTFALGKVDKSQMPPDVLVNLYDNEEQMLSDFLLTWQSLGIDIVTGWNVEFFDIPYIVHRIGNLLGEKYARKLSPWGKLRKRKVEFHGKESVTYEMVGINTLDYYQLYRKFTYVPRESYKLGFIAQAELGEGKTDHSEHDNFADFYRNDFTKFVLYNIQDTILVCKLEAKKRLIEQAVALAYSAKVNMSDVFSQVRTWEQIIYHHLSEKRIAIPQKRKNRKDMAYEGAYVKPPKVGMHRWVVSFDLDALYPMLICHYNLSPETKTKEGIRRAITASSVLKDSETYASSIATARRKNLSLAANGTTYRRDIQGFLPELMEKMYKQRKEYKRLMLETKAALKNLPADADPDERKRLETLASRYGNFQLVRKISLNSAYGALGNEWFRYYDEEIAEAITLSGQLAVRWVERDINRYIDKAIGTDGEDYVIAIDTDSVYLDLSKVVDKFLPGCKDERKVSSFLDRLSKEALQNVIQRSYERLSEKMNSYANHMRMKRECIASKGIWTGKKRYMLNVRIGEEDVYLEKPELKIMGIETARSSTPEVVRTALKKAVQTIMDKDESAIHSFVKKFRSEFHALSAEKIAFPRSCNGLQEYGDPSSVYRKATPIATKASLIYNWHIRRMKIDSMYQDIREGDKIKFIYLKTPNPIGEKVIAFGGKIPAEFGLEPYIDRDLQFEKAFLDPLRTILGVIGWHEEKMETLDGLFA